MIKENPKVKEIFAALTNYVGCVFAEVARQLNALQKKKTPMVVRCKRGPRKGKKAVLMVKRKPFWRNFGIKNAATLLK